MRRGWELETLARAALASWGLFGAAYALLCYSPMSWPMVEAREYPHWVAGALAAHGYWYLGATGLAIAALRRRPPAWFVAVQLGLGLGLFWNPLAHLRNDAWSLAAAFLVWGPLLAWELLILRSSQDQATVAAQPAPDENERVLAAAAGAGLAAFLVFTAGSWVRHGPPPSPAETVLALSWSLLLHLLVFLGLYSVWAALTSACRLRRFDAKLETAVLFSAAALCGAAVLYRAVFVSMSLQGGAMMLYSAFVAVLLAGSCFAQRRAPTRPAIMAVLLGLSASWAMTNAAAMDWNGLFQMSIVVLSWGLLFALVLSALPRRMPRLAPWQIIAPVLIPAWLYAGAAHAWHIPLAATLDRLERRDPSFRVARRIFSLRGDNGEFIAFLQKNTNLPRAVRLIPKDLRLVERFGPGLARKPDIFIIVIDSLRPDYLGAYNPAARFTPSIDAFASEGVVLRKAFANYSGTGLSEASFWSGSLLPHKQFVEPFRPLNSLEKLLEHDGYRRRVTKDVIHEKILRLAPSDRWLDGGRMDRAKFCGIVAELGEKPGSKESTGPLFTYSRSEDIHISVRQWEGAAAPASSVAGFYAPVAERIGAIDYCFGRFIRHLKETGRYDNSIVILTADHGDSLGEGGRWGHAYSIYPESLRIPMILHVPRRLLKGRRFDAERAAFLSDITPTLYDLLGHGPLRVSPVLGRSLLSEGPRPPQLVASAYSASYGLIESNGRTLYIADGIDHAFHLYDLEQDPFGARDLIYPQIKDKNNRVIREIIEEISRTVARPDAR